MFVGSMLDSSANLFALNGQTGDIIWQYKTGGPVFSSPALSKDEKVMYICSFDGNCYAFNSDSGELLWTFKGEAAYQSSPIVSEKYQQIYVASTDGVVYAINIKDGSQAWAYQCKYYKSVTKYYVERIML